MLKTIFEVSPSKEVKVKLNITQEVHFADGVVVKLKPVMNGDGFRGTKISVLVPESWRRRNKVHRTDAILWGQDNGYGIRDDSMEYRRPYEYTISHRKCNTRELVQVQLHTESGRNYGTLEFHHVESLI